MLAYCSDPIAPRFMSDVSLGATILATMDSFTAPAIYRR